MIVHLNGALIPAAEARLSVFDRGFIMGDSVYEGLRTFSGKVVALERHVVRMRAALKETRLPWDPTQLERLSDSLMAANAMPDAFVYWQISRGVPLPGQPVRSRIPAAPIPPTVFGYCAPQPPMATFEEGPPTVSAAICRDTRWERGHLKSCSLMGNVVASYEAAETGAQDVVFVRNGYVAEASASNVVIAVPGPDGRTEIATPSLDSVSILGGITRAQLLDEFPEIVSRKVRVEELPRASEVLICGSTAMVTSVTRLDGRLVGNGRPGPVAERLMAGLVRAIKRDLRLDATVAGQIRVAPVARDMLTRCTTPQAVA